MQCASPGYEQAATSVDWWEDKMANVEHAVSDSKFKCVEKLVEDLLIEQHSVVLKQ